MATRNQKTHTSFFYLEVKKIISNFLGRGGGSLLLSKRWRISSNCFFLAGGTGLTFG